jgi:hypothetical protein
VRGPCASNTWKRIIDRYPESTRSTSRAIRAGASEIRRDRAAEKTEFAHLTKDRGIRFRVPERVADTRDELALRVVARRLSDQPFFLGELASQRRQIIPFEFR